MKTVTSTVAQIICRTTHTPCPDHTISENIHSVHVDDWPLCDYRRFRRSIDRQRECFYETNKKVNVILQGPNEGFAIGVIWFLAFCPMMYFIDRSLRDVYRDSLLLLSYAREGYARTHDGEEIEMTAFDV